MVGPARGSLLSRPRRRHPLLRRIFLIGLVSTVAIGLAGGGFLYTYAGELPSLDNLSTHGLPQSSKIYDRTGKILLDERYADQRRTVVPLSQVSWDLRHATIAIEDRDFYNHGALSPLRLVAAAVYDLLHRHAAQGGSTITQQLVKNYLLSTLGSAQTLDRKIREALLALQLEQKYTKDQILEMYLNTIFYGNQSYGIETAAETYFNSTAAQLGAAEASFLAGLPQRPSYFDPFRPDGFQRARARQLDVLNAMVRDRYLTPAEATAAYAVDLQPKLAAAKNATVSRRSPIAPHFVDYVWDQLEQHYDPSYLRQGGLKIITTLDVATQQMAQKSVTDGVRSFASGYHVNNGAMLVMNPHTGEVLAMIGSADYFNQDIGGQVNYTVAARQPGSSFKPYTYVTALMNGWTPASPLDDSNGAHAFPGYVVHDWDGREEGTITLRQSLQQSRNISSVRLFKDVGVQKVLTVAQQLGITTKLEPNLSTTLGSNEVRMVDHLSAYSAFANGGTEVRPQAVLQVQDSSGAVIESNQPQPDAGQRVLPASITYVLTDILKGAVHPALGLSVAAKSGTTSDFKDAWYIGYSSDVAVATWMGRTVMKPKPQNLSMSGPRGGLWGETGPGVVWHKFMQAYYAAHHRPSDWLRPADVVAQNFCRQTGQPIDQAIPDLTITDIFLKTVSNATQGAVCGQPAAGPAPGPTPGPFPGPTDEPTLPPVVVPSIGPLPVPTPTVPPLP